MQSPLLLSTRSVHAILTSSRISPVFGRACRLQQKDAGRACTNCDANLEAASCNSGVFARLGPVTSGRVDGPCFAGIGCERTMTATRARRDLQA